MHCSSQSLMASPAQINVVEVCQIAPYFDSPESNNEFTLPLTFFDMGWLKFNPNERICFYQLTDSTAEFHRVILPKLKQSLSVTLRHFLPLAGRLTWPSNASKPIVHYKPNDTVSLTVAESKADFNRLSSDEVRETIESRPYIPALNISDSTSPVISLQITLFPDSGYSIGYSTHHAIIDGKSNEMFLKSWAHICKELPQSQLPKELTPFFDRTVVKDPEGLDMVYLNHWINMSKMIAPDKDPRSLKPYLAESITKPKLVRATLVLTREDISRMRDWVLSTETNVDELHLSSFVLAYAYTMVCIVKSIGEEKVVDLIHFIFASDCRTRLDSIPTNYFGNCVHGYDGFVDAKALMDKNGVILMAKKISELVKKAKSCGTLEGAKEALERYQSERPKTATIGIAGSPRFELYEVDFGWGRPKKVEIISIDKGGAIAMERSRYGDGGIEVGVAMAKHEMEVFDSLFVNGLKELHY